jgi:hypothetical protein
MTASSGTPTLRRFHTLIGLALALAAAASGPDALAQPRTGTTSTVSMKIQFEVDGTSITASLNDSAAARDFASLLPLTLSLKDYASTEKVADLPRKLSTQGAPAGIDPEIGDFTYYAPWGNLALFYKDFGYSAGLVRLGRIESGIAAIQWSGPQTVKIRRVSE